MTKGKDKAEAKGHAAGQHWSQPAHQARSRETRDRALAAAEEVFAARGYEGARMADIAEAAECSVGALYQRFKDKESLFTGIVEAFTEDARQRTAEALASAEGGPAEQLRRFIKTTATHLNAHRGLVRAILERGFGQAHLLIPLILMRTEVQKNLEAVIAVAGRTPDPLTVRVVTQVIYGFIQNSVVNPMALAQTGDVSALDELSNIVIGHLGLD